MSCDGVDDGADDGATGIVSMRDSEKADSKAVGPSGFFPTNSRRSSNSSPPPTGTGDTTEEEGGQAHVMIKTEDSNSEQHLVDIDTVDNTASCRAKKKKGTAVTIKRRRRASKKGGGSKKKSPSKNKTGNASGESEEEDADGEGDDESESDSGPYCLCRGPDNHRFMIACDRCEDWFHGECINMDKFTGENVVQKYICPNCTDKPKGFVTRYKKLCSLEGCDKPARISDEDRSVFCSPDHCQAWWEQLIAALPKAGNKKNQDVLLSGQADLMTQETFMGLLNTGPKRQGDDGAMPWRPGQKPFAASPDFWNRVALDVALTEEERTFLWTSASDRYNLEEEIILCKKMHQLVEMAHARRESAIASLGSSGQGAKNDGKNGGKAQKANPHKDFCGYDTRLDTVGVPHAFAAWLESSDGEAVFRAGRLDTPPGHNQTGLCPSATDASEESDPATAGMCTKKKCKPHGHWNFLFTKLIKKEIKELAYQAKEKLEVETRVKECAAIRYLRRQKEKNTVEVCASSENEDESMPDL